MSVQIRARLNPPKLGACKMLETRVGFEPLRVIDATQLIHSATRKKRQNGQISRIEVHAGQIRLNARQKLTFRPGQWQGHLQSLRKYPGEISGEEYPRLLTCSMLGKSCVQPRPVSRACRSQIHQPISQRASSWLHRIAEHHPTTACPRALAPKIAALRRERTPKHPTYSQWRAAA